MDAKKKKKTVKSQVPDLGANWANWQNCFLNDWYGEMTYERKLVLHPRKLTNVPYF